MFVLLFKNGDDDPSIYSFDQCYMPLIEIQDFNELIDNKPFFDHPGLKTNKKCMKNLLKCQGIVIVQQGIYSSFHFINVVINSLV